MVSSHFASSTFINENELVEFFRKKQEENYLILPILVRDYDFSQFEELGKLNFFKTYNEDYGFNKPFERDDLLPFDRLADSSETTNRQLNLYYKNLADFIHTAVSNKFKS